MKKNLLSVLLIGCSIFSLAQPAGSLDAGFGTGGKVVSSFSSGIEEAKAVVLQEDGKIVVAGFAQFAATGKDFLVARYLTDGALDNTFGTNGVWTLDLQLGSDDVAHSMVIDASGRMILAGSSDDGVNKNAAMLRLLPDGTLDTSFGNNGIVLTDFISGNQDEVKVVKQHLLTGKLILGGQSASTSNLAVPIIARYSSEGVLDTTFNSTGILSATTTAGDLQRNMMIEDLEVVANGKISAVGWRKYISTSISSDFWACRVLSNGTMDNTFSTDGAVAYAEVGGACYGYSLVINANQDLIVGGTRSYLGNNDFRIITITNSGTIPTTSSNYFISTDVDIAYAMTTDVQGKYILAGSAGTTTARSFGTLRLLAPGDLQSDYSFDSDGRIMTSFNGNLLNECWDVVVQNDNKIVCVGYAGNDIALCRYLGTGVPQLDAFNLSSPANNSVNLSFTSLNLSWTEAYGATEYEVEVATDVNFNNIVLTGPVVSAAAVLTNLQPATAFWWRVRAGDGTNWGAYAGPWKFTTVGLNAFTLTTPSNNASNIAYASVNFNWTDNPGASGYQLMVDADPNFTSSPVNYYPTTSALIITNLLPSTTYYWKVRATNDGTNYGPWVGSWVFNTQTATVGISELSQEVFLLYPNPAHDHVAVKGNSFQIGEVIQIFDQQGRCVQSQTITTKGTQLLTLQTLANGVYHVKVGANVLTLLKE
ncbi:MAG: hypothetical protein RLY35_843 [Bacteroidota bacterium]